MRAAVEQFPYKSFPKTSEPDLTTKNAWAQIVRRKFYGQNLVKACMREWPRLTERQARGLVYAEASQNTIDIIIKSHPFKGFALSIEVAAIVTGVHLEDYANYVAEEGQHAVAKFEAEERLHKALASRLGEPRPFTGRGSR